MHAAPALPLVVPRDVVRPAYEQHPLEIRPAATPAALLRGHRAQLRAPQRRHRDELCARGVPHERDVARVAAEARETALEGERGRDAHVLHHLVHARGRVQPVAHHAHDGPVVAQRPREQREVALVTQRPAAASASESAGGARGGATGGRPGTAMHKEHDRQRAPRASSR